MAGERIGQHGARPAGGAGKDWPAGMGQVVSSSSSASRSLSPSRSLHPFLARSLSLSPTLSFLLYHHKNSKHLLPSAQTIKRLS